MYIKYVGEKPTISQHGVTFNHAKEDKYVYLKGAIHILHLIDPKHKKEFDNNIPDNEISIILQEYEPNIEINIQKEELKYEKKLQHEIKNVQQNNTLKEIEKEVWIKNIKLMQSYRIQRSINKIYYEHAIKIIEKVIKKEQITKIVLPFDKYYFHLLKSIKSKLEIGRSYLDSDIKIEMDHDLMILEFNIKVN
ncbi:hypothetical protein KKC13_11395 [bacterium]|nr:hypothetical protein [bacterium]MBU1957943.1 hypothetical protein [bacterium]